MMRSIVGTLGITACVFALGCGAEEGSSEGLVRQFMACSLKENAIDEDGNRVDVPPEEAQKLVDAFRALAAKFPFIERFEWGRTDSGRCTHCVLVTVTDSQTSRDPAYMKAGQEAFREHRNVEVPGVSYVAHDATPHVRTPTRGHLRRMMTFWVKKKGIAPEEIKKLEGVLTALPSKISGIERLEWGTAFPPQIDPKHFMEPMQQDNYCLLLTFKNTSARDACLSHPAYQEFRDMLKHYTDRDPPQLEYVARN